MSTRNRAKKSTGTRGSTVSSTSVGNNSNSQTGTRRGPSNLNDSSSDSDVPTQRLSRLSMPGPSGVSSVASTSRLLESDSDYEENIPQRIPNRKRGRMAREESSSDTTSDSDAPDHHKSPRKTNNLVNRKKNLSKPKATPTNSNGRQNSSNNNETTQPSNTPSIIKHNPTSSRPLDQIQSRNIKSLVNKCVYFFLIMDQKKHAIKRTEILKHVFENQDHKLYNIVLEDANKALKQVYGLEIIKSEKRKGKQNEYLLINYLDRNLSVQQFAEISSTDLQKRGLIFYLLTVIFMNENFIKEDDLWEALKPLGIDINSRTPHPIFGDVQKYISSELVKQMYLEYTCISKDPPHWEFSWGIRANQEVDKKDLLEFSCQIMSDTKPEDWILQYKDALEATKLREDSQKNNQPLFTRNT